MLYRSGQAVPAREARPRNGDHAVDLALGNELRMAVSQLAPRIAFLCAPDESKFTTAGTKPRRDGPALKR